MQKIITIVLITLIGINVAYTAAGVAFHPLQSMDAIGIWLLKAKAFYVEGGFPYAFLHNTTYLYSHPQYPLLLPFLAYLFYLASGGINDHAILFIYPACYLCILGITYYVLRSKTSSTTALLFTYIYSMLSALIAAGGRVLAGNADIFLVLIEWIIIAIIYKKQLTRDDSILVTLLVMVASLIKLEGAFLAILLVFIPKDKRQKLLFFIASLLPTLIWLYIAHSLRIPSDMHMVFPSAQTLIERLGIIAVGILKELFNVNNWYIFWPLFSLVLIVKGQISTQMKKILLPALAVLFLLYGLVYLFSSIDTYNYINSSFDRVLLQQSPIVFLYFFEKMNSVFLTNKHTIIGKLLHANLTTKKKTT